MEGMQKFKFWDEFLGRVIVLVSRAIFNRLT